MPRKRSEHREDREEQRPPAEWTIDVPNDPITEQVVIAAMAVDPAFRARARKMFPPDAFYAEEHRAMAQALYELERRKLGYDPAMLARLGGDKFDLSKFTRIVDRRPDLPPNIDEHVGNLLWDWKRAQAAQGPIAGLLEAIADPKEAPERVRALARQVGEAFDGAVGAARYLRDPKEVVREMMTEVRRRIEGEAFYPYGIDGIDFFEDGSRRLRPGAAPGLIAMVTAMTGGGKTSLTGHLALGIARQGRKVLYGAWEVYAPMTLEMLATFSLGWSRSRMLDGKTNRVRDDASLSAEELVQLEERAHAISKKVVFFDNPFRRHDSGRGKRTTNDDHLDVVEEHLVESGCEVFIADLWQRCLRGTRPEDEQEALFRQQAMAEEHRIHVVLVHQQLTKGIDLRQDRKPTREGIKGSGAWLDVCSTVLAPHLPAKWKRVPDDKMELYVLKQRFGAWPLGIELDWDPDTGQVTGGRSIAYDDHGGETSEDATGMAPVSRRTKKRRGI